MFLNLDENTIVSFEPSSQLQDLGIEKGNSASINEHPIDEQKFSIRMVNSEGRREAGSVLIKKMYSWRGYAVDSLLDNKPNKITLVADTAGKTVGTMTLVFDTEIGLPADEHYKDRLDELRAQGRRLCEPSRLAIDNNVPKRLFASLIHISYIYAHKIHGFTDYVIEVNPRHATFYKKMLGFKEFGEERNCTRVNAPAVLLRVELQYMTEQIKKFGGLMKQNGNEKSFYSYFFSSKDEPGITSRLKHGKS